MIKEIKSNLVTVSNNLVTASYSMSLLEKRLLILAVSYINNSENMRKAITENEVFTIKVKDYAEIFRIDYETAKDEIAVAVERLYDQDLIYTHEGKTVRTRWVSYLPNYNKSTHEVEVVFSPGITPLISELSSNFSSYRMLFLCNLSSVYSIRLYELFYTELRKSYKNKVKVYFSIDFLRNLFRLENKYDLTADFIRWIIKEPLEEIKKHTNIYVHFLDKNEKPMYVKQGRKIVGLHFWIHYKEKLNVPEEIQWTQ